MSTCINTAHGYGCDTRDHDRPAPRADKATAGGSPFGEARARALGFDSQNDMRAEDWHHDYA